MFYILQLHQTLVRAIEEHVDLKTKVQDLLPQYVSYLTPYFTPIFLYICHVYNVFALQIPRGSY